MLIKIEGLKQIHDTLSCQDVVQLQ